MENIERLKREIARREEELAALKVQLVAEEAEVKKHTDHDTKWSWPLQPEDYLRYSRQMIVPGFGLKGQQRIQAAKVLLVGAGGLGCPASAYLAGAGVGTIGLADADQVEVSNLHRQIAHATDRVGMSKVDSAIVYLKGLNPTITYKAHHTHLTPQNAQEIVSQYDLVLDCTDHPTSRYLISDACVLLGKPLVSASAFQAAGQLMVLNNPPGKGPCYRCVFPKAPPPESVVGCGEGGIIGPVVGVMGVLQALESIKLIIRGDLEPSDLPARQMTMLIFGAMADTPFRTVRMRGRRADCFACSDGPDALTLEQMASSLDYVQFCGVVQPVKVLEPHERVTVAQYQKAESQPHLLIDTREKEHFSLNTLPNAINIPISRFMSHRKDADTASDWVPPELPPTAPIYVVCRVGNDSQLAARKLKDLGFDNDGQRFIGDIQGGIKAWKDAVDPTMPFF